MLRTSRNPLLGALACLAGLVLTGVLAYLVPLVQAGDAAALQGFKALNRPRLTPLIDQIAHLGDPVPYAILGLGLVAIALVGRRPRQAAAIVALLGLTGWTTQTLKPVLAAPRHDEWLGTGQIALASWPSGHATAAMTLALCAILAVGARARPAAAGLGALFAVGVSYSILALGWHLPSDVLGGFLVATTWTLLAVAGLEALERRWPSAPRGDVRLRPSEALAPIWLGAGVAAAAVGVWLSRPDEVARFAADHPTFVAGAAGIAALAVALALGLARGVRSA